MLFRDEMGAQVRPFQEAENRLSTHKLRFLDRHPLGSLGVRGHPACPPGVYTKTEGGGADSHANYIHLTHTQTCLDHTTCLFVVADTHGEWDVFGLVQNIGKR